MSIKKVIALAVILIAILTWLYRQPSHLNAAAQEAGEPVGKAYAERARGRMIAVRGTVARLLSDDRDGSPHQRFVVRTASGLTVLVSHNLDIAQRLEGLRVGDMISLYGEYEWNEQGGVMHWTHKDPAGHHAAGYIDWNGRRYQ